MIEIKDKKDCCGCTACESICPKNCIKILADDEGFVYPEIDIQNCIECGLCRSVCPVINVAKDEAKEQQGFLVQHKDELIRKDSTAGGAFSAIAGYVLDKGGVVFGVQYDDELNVRHTYVEKKEDLYKYRNSKYVQSDLRGVFKQVKSFLDSDRWVCFSGTPCQVEGLYHFLKKDYEKLVLVDVMCHAVPSPAVWDKYKTFMKEKYGNITNIRFRDKYYGYGYSSMSIYKDKNAKPIYHEGIDTDFMLRAFFSDICDRPSCYDCKFKKRYRVSDFTIWDCYKMNELCKEMNDDKGTTRVLIHTEKGAKIFNKVSSEVNFKEIEADILVEGVKEMYHSVAENKYREDFFRDLNSLDFTELINKYFSLGIKSKMEKYIRIALYKLKIYELVKKLAKKIIKNKSRM